LETKQKNGDEAQNLTNKNINAYPPKSFGDKVVSTEIIWIKWQGQTDCCQAKAETSYLIDIVRRGRLWCNIPTHLCLLISNRLSVNWKYICGIKTGSEIIM
jgi:hypothetical protein